MTRCGLVTRAWLRLAVAVAIVLGLFSASGGCAPSKTTVKIDPLDASRPRASQTFSRVYFAPSDMGGYDIVLVEDGIRPRVQSGKPNAPLQPAEVEPLRQVMHLRVLWRPLPGSKPDQPSATNAVIRWVITSNLPRHEADRLEYQGAGFVSIYPNAHAANVLIRSASINPAAHTGELEDLIGRSTLAGTFEAVRNEGIVHDVLASIEPVAQASSR